MAPEVCITRLLVHYVCAHAQLCPSLCDPRTVARQAPLSMGFPRQEYWSGLPFPPPGDLPSPGIEPRSPALQVDSLSAEPPGKPLVHQGFPGLPWPTVLSFSLLGCISHSVKYRMDEATHVTTSSLKKIHSNMHSCFLSPICLPPREEKKNPQPKALLSGLIGGVESNSLEERIKRPFPFGWNMIWFVHSTYILKKK